MCYHLCHHGSTPPPIYNGTLQDLTKIATLRPFVAVVRLVIYEEGSLLDSNEGYKLLVHVQIGLHVPVGSLMNHENIAIKSKYLQELAISRLSPDRAKEVTCPSFTDKTLFSLLVGPIISL